MTIIGQICQFKPDEEQISDYVPGKNSLRKILTKTNKLPFYVLSFVDSKLMLC